jgi:hypothetical protein
LVNFPAGIDQNTKRLSIQGDVCHVLDVLVIFQSALEATDACPSLKSGPRNPSLATQFEVNPIYDVQGDQKAKGKK